MDHYRYVINERCIETHKNRLQIRYLSKNTNLKKSTLQSKKVVKCYIMSFKNKSKQKKTQQILLIFTQKLRIREI